MRSPAHTWMLCVVTFYGHSLCLNLVARKGVPRVWLGVKIVASVPDLRDTNMHTRALYTSQMLELNINLLDWTCQQLHAWRLRWRGLSLSMAWWSPWCWHWADCWLPWTHCCPAGMVHGCDIKTLIRSISCPRMQSCHGHQLCSCQEDWAGQPGVSIRNVIWPGAGHKLRSFVRSLDCAVPVQWYQVKEF